MPLLPLIAFLLIFFAYPVLQLLWLSIVDAKGAISLVHYEQLFASSLYLRVMAITFRIAAWTTVFCLVTAYPIAYLLAQAQGRVRSSLLLWVLMPFWTSFLVRTFAWIVLLGRNGAINDLLLTLGVVGQPLELIYNETAVMIGLCHAMLPLSVLTMFSVMQNIDRAPMLAASTLGARRSEAFWRIYFPQSMPGVAAAGLLVFLSTTGFFITPALLGSPREMMIAQVIIFQIDDQANFGFAGAIAVLMLLLTFALFFIYDRMLGMSTLAGAAASSQGAFQTRGWLRRAGRQIGTIATSALGRFCSTIESVVEPLVVRRNAPPRRLGSWVAYSVGGLLFAFLAVPSFFVIPISFTETQFLAWPPKGFTWRWYEEIFASPQWRAATLRSLLVGIATAALAIAVGTPAAFAMTRRKLRAKSATLAFILAPLILPNIIIAVALFYFYARIGLIGHDLALIFGHSIIAVPFVVITVMAVLKNYDERLDLAAASLGAGKVQTFYRITFPLIRPGMIAAFVFAFVRSFDELTIALFVTGGLTNTLPKQMWTDAVLMINPRLTAVSTILLVFVTSAILFAEWLSRSRARA